MQLYILTLVRNDSDSLIYVSDGLGNVSDSLRSGSDGLGDLSDGLKMCQMVSKMCHVVL